jgi:hypothetical protein
MIRPVRALGGLMLVALLGSVTSLSGQGAADKVTVEKIDYAGLGRFIRGQTGKVVVVDFWADF